MESFYALCCMNEKCKGKKYWRDFRMEIHNLGCLIRKRVEYKGKLGGRIRRSGPLVDFEMENCDTTIKKAKLLNCPYYFQQTEI